MTPVISFTLSRLTALVALSLFSATVARTTSPVTSEEMRIHGEASWRVATSLWGSAPWRPSGPSGFGPSANRLRFEQIRLQVARQLSPRLGEGVTVAILDTGVDSEHPDLRGVLNHAAAYDFITRQSGAGEEEGGSYTGHGTAVAGIIHQIAPRARLLPLRVLTAEGRGASDNVARAILYAADQGANVINLSLGCAQRKPVITAAIENVMARGVIVVSSVGNQNRASADYPAAEAPQAALLVSVGSVDAQGTKSSFSNYGNTEVNANGERVATLFPGGTTNVTGTSFATPQVVGLIALALAEGRTPREVTERLVGGAERLDALSANAPYLGQLGGLVNATRLYPAPSLAQR
ncbi:S8 family serine peptidase [Deinococcus peraridilitoris]|uniref:Subtilisin-like serine protease n=1 Tax=Deinococcus peraridilitoris (strain DSM 19664 / LMG 22246 / CIP 109416 / KR-200) TaxID=937777 RepID=L0A107_DEIPD|nr:S8 family serine peptidase [Deinococcus peraridilitoris]AFZ67531.1 subtilisin-like serine protease [Deinococcus peraridilitoris DSM 19664]